MADEDEDEDLDAEDGEDGEGGEEGEGGGSGGGKKKLIIIVALALLLAIGAAAGAYFTGLADPLLAMLGAGPAAEDVAVDENLPPEATVFYDLPEMMVNLNTTGRKNSYLKIRVALALTSQEDTLVVEQVLPRIVDNFQVYLRELRLDDLQGAAGMYRLREELLTRVNAAAKPAKVSDVLFKEMLVQ